MARILFIVFILALFPSCTSGKRNVSADHLLNRAQQVLKTTPIVDTHIDFPWHLVERNKWYKPGYTAFALKNPEGDFDLERARKGGLYGAFMSIYIPSAYQKEPGRPKQVADSLIDMVHAIAKEYPGQFALALHADDVLAQFKKGIVSLPMGMENGAPIESLADVAYFHRRGIRYVTPADRHARRFFFNDTATTEIYTQAKKRTPQRWTGPTRNWSPIGPVYLNPVKQEDRIQPLATPVS